LFSKYKIPELLLQEIIKYSNIAFKNIEQLSISNKNKAILIQFGKGLMGRKS